MWCIDLEPTEIALRAFVVSKSYANLYVKNEKNTDYTEDVVLVLDTETTTDRYLNLNFGSCGIWVSGHLHQIVIFYSKIISQKDLETLKRYATRHKFHGSNIKLMPVEEFIEEIFFPWAYDNRALVIGFNLPFDLSRLAIYFSVGRRKWKNGFSFQLSKNPFRPRIRIKSLDSTKSFIEFCKQTKNCEKKVDYKGRFLDLRTLGFALTNEKVRALSLKNACKLFNCQIGKMEAEAHGRITPEYIKYNLNDVDITYHLYLKMKERLESFNVDVPPEKVYSPATFGKAYLEKMGIQPFLKKNPNFPKLVLGYIMTTFYGGRAEVRIRKKPVKVRYMDFGSMYPSLFELFDLWPYLTADRIEIEDITAEVKHIVNKIDLTSIRDKELWKSLVVIVQIQPDNNIFPVRSHYGNKEAYNIGINYLTSDTALWYALPDVIASKLLTRKTPKILKAIRFIPIGRQPKLKPIQIVGGLTVKPNENLITTLVKYRREIQREKDQQPKNSSEYERLHVIQNQLKIIANASSYGIFIEINTENEKPTLDVYGLTHFKSKASKKENFGKCFNPIIATMLTSGARLLLAMTEAWLNENKGYYTFCDTDGIAVSPRHWKRLQQCFEPLNPFPPDEQFLKLEKENFEENGNLRDLWFYGISAKRYVLYIKNKEGKMFIEKPNTHGLAHILNRDENWEKQLWQDILNYEHNRITKDEFLSKYKGKHIVSKLTITSPHILNWVKKLNQNQEIHQQIKPSNFLLVASPAIPNENGEMIHPLTTFTKNYNEAPFQPFVDYKTGKLYSENTDLYWKTMDQAIAQYIDHPESKFKNGDKIGKMKRRHLKVCNVTYIGRESNELEESEVLGVSEDSYVKYGINE